MAIFQALLLLLRRSFGKIFEAVFGWAVYSLFGQVPRKDKALLSAAVGAAAAWPVLVFGVFFPRAAAAILAFLPVPKGIPSEIVRIVWIVLALAVPILVGLVFGRKGRTSLSKGQRILLGLPITVGLGAAFLLLCVTAPVARIAAMSKGRKQEDAVLIVPPGRYGPVADELLETLRHGGLSVEPAPAPWHVRAVSWLLGRLGGASLTAYVPEQIRFFRGADLEATVYPGGVSLSGSERIAARAHSLIVERASRTEALQTTDPQAQKLERDIKAIWEKVDAGRKGAALGERLTSLFARIADLDADYEDWESLYRQALQLSVAARGGRQLLERAVSARTAEKGSRVSARLAHSARGYARTKLLSSTRSGFVKLAGKLASRMLSRRRWRL